jgi:uncharacterized RDD family membrane protein YckC
VLSDIIATMWCWSCGAEYRAGYARCPDCDTDLVEHPPRKQHDAAGHEQLEYDLAGWSSAQRQAAVFWLERMEIPAEWRPDGVLVVPSAREIQVDDLLDSLEDDDEAPDELVLPPLPAMRGAGEAPELAGPGRRFAGFLIDWLVLSVAGVFLYLLTGGHVASYATSLAIDAAYFIVGTALWGRTVGKLALHMVVVRTDGVEPPGWRVAIVRWLIVSIAIPLGYIGIVGGVLSLGWTVAVFMPIFLPERRGIHDRGAGTQVLLRIPVAPD